MQRAGVAILYITHRLDEVFAIANHVCVLRDGRVSLKALTRDVDQATVVNAMVGREVSSQHETYSHAPKGQGAVLETENLGSEAFTDVRLSIEPGEILGIYGKVGSGAPELAGALFGETEFTRGTLRINGDAVRFRHPAEAIRRGVGFLPADRARDGLLKTRSVAENLAAPSWKRLAKRLMIFRSFEEKVFRTWHATLKVRSSPDGSEQISTLSGGNQQKVLLGRWLEAGSTMLVLIEPTRGVDVGARQEIYAVLRNLARTGRSILIASSDYEDITEVATRAMVMVRGRVVAQLAQNEISTERLTQAAGGAADA